MTDIYTTKIYISNKMEEFDRGEPLGLVFIPYMGKNTLEIADSKNGKTFMQVANDEPYEGDLCSDDLALITSDIVIPAFDSQLEDEEIKESVVKYIRPVSKRLVVSITTTEEEHLELENDPLLEPLNKMTQKKIDIEMLKINKKLKVTKKD